MTDAEYLQVKEFISDLKELDTQQQMGLLMAIEGIGILTAKKKTAN